MGLAMGKPGVIEQAWWAYERRRLAPVGAGAVQRQECRRAFYAGAIAVFHGLVTGVSSETGETPEDMALMDGVKAELDQYAADLGAGRA